jgi:hypothetical protein
MIYELLSQRRVCSITVFLLLPASSKQFALRILRAAHAMLEWRRDQRARGQEGERLGDKDDLQSR